MNIPIELFIVGIAIAVFLAVLGFMARNSKAGMFTVIAGMVIFSMTAMTQNHIMGYEPTAVKFVNLQELYHVHDWDSDRALFAGFATIRAIHTIDDSALISEDFFDRLDCIQFPLRKVGSPTGTADIAVFDTNGVLKPIQFGSLDVSTLTTSYAWREFCLSASMHHFIKDGDYIGIRFAGGDVSNHIVIPVDTTNPVNPDTFMSRFLGGTWTDEPTLDMVAVMYNRALIEEHEIEPILEPFTTESKVMFGMISAIFMILGAIIMRSEK